MPPVCFRRKVGTCRLYSFNSALVAFEVVANNCTAPECRGQRWTICYGQIASLHMLYVPNTLGCSGTFTRPYCACSFGEEPVGQQTWILIHALLDNRSAAPFFAASQWLSTNIRLAHEARRPDYYCTLILHRSFFWVQRSCDCPCNGEWHCLGEHIAKRLFKLIRLGFYLIIVRLERQFRTLIVSVLCYTGTLRKKKVDLQKYPFCANVTVKR